MVLTREGTGVASAEGSPEIDGNKKKNLFGGHFGEAMKAKADGEENEGRSFCCAREVISGFKVFKNKHETTMVWRRMNYLKYLWWFSL